MAMILNEEQNMLRDSARDFVSDKGPVSAFRKIRDEENADGFDKALWTEMAELGWAGVIIPEEFGGADFGFQGLGVVLEETGRTLLPSPLVSTIVLGSSALNRNQLSCPRLPRANACWPWRQRKVPITLHMASKQRLRPMVTVGC